MSTIRSIIQYAASRIPQPYTVPVSDGEGRISVTKALIKFFEQSSINSDPPDPPPGQWVMWQSDGTGTGENGDILFKVTDSDGTTKLKNFDHFPATHPFYLATKLDTTTIENTTTETTVCETEIHADEIRSGTTLHLTLMGTYTNASTADDWTIRFKLGGTTYDVIDRTGGKAAGRGWKATFTLTFRSSGATAEVYDHSTLIDGQNIYSQDSGASHTIDTSVAETVSVTLQWNNAKVDNVFHCTQAFLERAG